MRNGYCRWSGTKQVLPHHLAPSGAGAAHWPGRKTSLTLGRWRCSSCDRVRRARRGRHTQEVWAPAKRMRKQWPGRSRPLFSRSADQTFLAIVHFAINREADIRRRSTCGLFALFVAASVFDRDPLSGHCLGELDSCELHDVHLITEVSSPRKAALLAKLPGRSIEQLSIGLVRAFRVAPALHFMVPQCCRKAITDGSGLCATSYPKIVLRGCLLKDLVSKRSITCAVPKPYLPDFDFKIWAEIASVCASQDWMRESAATRFAYRVIDLAVIFLRERRFLPVTLEQRRSKFLRRHIAPPVLSLLVLAKGAGCPDVIQTDPAQFICADRFSTN